MGDGDTERKAMRTYVPAYQKQEWVKHAQELNMSHSEYIRCMVQAGRKGFVAKDEEAVTKDATPRGKAIDEHLLEVLKSGPKSWNELSTVILDETERVLNSFQEESIVSQSRDGIWAITDDEWD